MSFCTLDPKNKKLFAFINKKRRRKFCHVFQASEHDVSDSVLTDVSDDEVLFSFQAQKMVETMAEAFEFTYKRVELKREQKEVGSMTIVQMLLYRCQYGWDHKQHEYN